MFYGLQCCYLMSVYFWQELRNFARDLLRHFAKVVHQDFEELLFCTSQPAVMAASKGLLHASKLVCPSLSLYSQASDCAHPVCLFLASDNSEVDIDVVSVWPPNRVHLTVSYAWQYSWRCGPSRPAVKECNFFFFMQRKLSPAVRSMEKKLNVKCFVKFCPLTYGLLYANV